MSNASAAAEGRDYTQTLFLPQTEFPMRAGLPEKEPRLLARWKEINLYRRLREQAKDRPRFVLHDGPPYANGNIHIGHALNKILKDMVTRSQQMLGFDSNYVPGWDCHGLPIEWKIEEQYREKGRNKDDVPVVQFRQECRAYATHWLSVQREEFKRLGITGDWENPYSTMSFPAEAEIAREIMKFAMTGQLYRGSKPVMWSVVEKTSLAEAEIEYHDYQSDMIWAVFPVASAGVSAFPGVDIRMLLEGGRPAVVIWTTTPWTIPGNRAIAYNPKVAYGLYRVTEAPENNWAKVGQSFVLADKLAAEVFRAAKVTGFEKLCDADPARLGHCRHPLAGLADSYLFDVPMLAGDHVTDDAGTGFVHTAPGHGREDFDIWMANGRLLAGRGIDSTIPYTVDGDGFYTADAPGFTGRRVITDKGEKGDANEAVIKALVEQGRLLARGRLKHQYPHSWRSKKPVIFRNTPQWFISMDRPLSAEARAGFLENRATESEDRRNSPEPTLRELSLEAIRETQWVPPQGENRITGMIEAKPDWVVSRQRAWGVPITVFVHRESGEILRDPAVNARIAAAFEAEGADAWFVEGAAARFLAPDHDPAMWEKVGDVLDVWFDSGSTHAFTLEKRADLATRRVRDGGRDKVMYLEGSDQHRGWFHSSLIESVGTRGRAPYDVVLTHGFVLDEKGEKMSKSLGNTVAPQTVIKDSGADILRLWVAAADYSDDLRIGPNILKGFVESYRKLRNSLRWMLGALAHFDGGHVEHAAMPQLERLMLHRLAELDPVIRKAYADFEYRRVVTALSAFMNTELSAFYFDIRKDALYCDAPSSLRRRAALTAIDHILDSVLRWLAPILVFTAEEAWLARHGESDGASVHLRTFPEIPSDWRDEALAERWTTIRAVRSVVTGALEVKRAAKEIGSSLEAAPVVYVGDPAILQSLAGVDMAEITITSALTLTDLPAPEGSFRLDEVKGAAVNVLPAAGRKCARSWRYTEDVGKDPDFPDVSARDAAALRERRALGLPA